MSDSPICRAPATNLFLRPDGEVRACCRNDRVLGRIGEQSLGEIWRGVRRSELRGAVDGGDLSLGCSACGEEIAAEGAANAYPRVFDAFDSVPGGTWPSRIEFNLSNACNLQCVQCDGDLSSAIRTHREHRPPLPSPYDEAFFAELASFIPHLRWASFAGGEPFLAEANYRVWELVRRLNPDLEGTIVTNGTRWGSRESRAVDGLRLGITLSIDAADPAVFDSVRVGARHEEVMVNAESMMRDARRRGGPVSVNFCLMRTNALELPDVLEWAEGYHVPVNVSVVRSPRALSLVDAPTSEIASIAASLRRRADQRRGRLPINGSTLDAEIRRIEAWALEDPDPVRLRGVGRFKVLIFPCEGRRGGAPRDPRYVLTERHPGADVSRIVVDRYDQIVSVDSQLDALINREANLLIGRPVVEFADLVLDRRAIVEQPDWHEVAVRLPGGAAQVVLQPDRDATGWAETASIWIVPI